MRKSFAKLAPHEMARAKSTKSSNSSSASIDFADARWQFGLPPRGNANFAWVQHFIQTTIVAPI
jgi:hypothetical protein